MALEARNAATGGRGGQNAEASIDSVETERLAGIVMRIITLSFVIAIVGAALPVVAQTPKSADKEVRIAGCVQWETDYRRARNEGAGGALGTGIGVGNEFVLTMVKPEGSRKATAYSITGDREKELGRRIGQQVEVIGVLEDEGKANSERFGDLPRIRMTGWVPIRDTCTP